MDEIPDGIPADIWAKAGMAVVHAPEYTLRLHEDVASALLAEREAATKAERERCALITQKWNYQPMNTAHAIATAIRSGARP